MVYLNSVDVEWYEKTYEGASLSWILSALLEKFREAHVHTPGDYALIAAKAMSAEIDG